MGNTATAGSPPRAPDPRYRVVAGPEGYLSPAAAAMGIELPNEGYSLVEGESISDSLAPDIIAERLLGAHNPTLFPGPLVLWGWSDASIRKARALQELVREVPGMKMIPMPDYRPKYPKIDPAIEINPNHPNLTIWHNEIDVCVFAGVHCHFANIALKIIRSGTDCYTIALCGERGHEDAMVTMRDVGEGKVAAITAAVRRLKAGGHDA